jgi:AcrR family transcriptional regulator
MKQTSNSRQVILKEAYKLFLTNNVEKVTISEIEKATKKIRGSIFYYFKSKQAIFNAVVEEMFFQSFRFPVNLIEIAISQSFEQFLDSYTGYEQRAILQIKKLYEMEKPEIAYYDFISQANRYYPDFKNKFNEIVQKDYDICSKIIRVSQDKNELKIGDSKKLAFLLLKINSGATFFAAYSPGIFDDYSVICSQFYQLIKK